MGGAAGGLELGVLLSKVRRGVARAADKIGGIRG